MDHVQQHLLGLDQVVVLPRQHRVAVFELAVLLDGDEVHRADGLDFRPRLRDHGVKGFGVRLGVPFGRRFALDGVGRNLVFGYNSVLQVLPAHARLGATDGHVALAREVFLDGVAQGLQPLFQPGELVLARPLLKGEILEPPGVGLDVALDAGPLGGRLFHAAAQVNHLPAVLGHALRAVGDHLFGLAYPLGQRRALGGVVFGVALVLGHEHVGVYHSGLQAGALLLQPLLVQVVLFRELPDLGAARPGVFHFDRKRAFLLAVRGLFPEFFQLPRHRVQALLCLAQLAGQNLVLAALEVRAAPAVIPFRKRLFRGGGGVASLFREFRKGGVHPAEARVQRGLCARELAEQVPARKRILALRVLGPKFNRALPAGEKAVAGDVDCLRVRRAGDVAGLFNHEHVAQQAVCQGPDGRRAFDHCGKPWKARVRQEGGRLAGAGIRAKQARLARIEGAQAHEQLDRPGAVGNNHGIQPCAERGFERKAVFLRRFKQVRQGPDDFAGLRAQGVGRVEQLPDALRIFVFFGQAFFKHPDLGAIGRNLAEQFRPRLLLLVRLFRKRVFAAGCRARQLLGRRNVRLELLDEPGHLPAALFIARENALLVALFGFKLLAAERRGALGVLDALEVVCQLGKTALERHGFVAKVPDGGAHPLDRLVLLLQARGLFRQVAPGFIQPGLGRFKERAAALQRRLVLLQPGGRGPDVLLVLLEQRIQLGNAGLAGLGLLLQASQPLAQLEVLFPRVGLEALGFARAGANTPHLFLGRSDLFLQSGKRLRVLLGAPLEVGNLGRQRPELVSGREHVHLPKPVVKLLVAPGLSGLALKRDDLALDFPHYIGKAQQVLLRLLELPERFLAVGLVFRDAAGLLEYLAPVLRPGGKYQVYPALAHE